MTDTNPFDAYLAECVRCCLRGQSLPDWPAGLALDLAEGKARLDFHGIALLMADHAPGFFGWPDPLVSAIHDMARLQALWEAGHAEALARLLAALDDAGIAAIVMKGTALAYSVHSDPAYRRRGDTDLLIEGAARPAVRRIFKAQGFTPQGEVRALQEPWRIATPSGFEHEVDLHWAISSSMAISQAIEADHPRRRTIKLPRLAQTATATGPLDSFLHICLNRASHRQFGYGVEEVRVFDQDRLIWAVDLDLISQSLSSEQWDELARLACDWGVSELAKSGATFAQRALKTDIPARFFARLDETGAAGNRLSSYYCASKSHEWVLRDIAAAPTFALKRAVVAQHMFATPDMLRERYPHAQNWPLFALSIRRLLDGAARMLLGAKQ